MSELLYSILIAIHIGAGCISLLAGMISMISKKGGAIHTSAGGVYVVGMSLIFLTAVPTSLRSGSFFLLVIAIFSYYMVFTGFRFPRLKKAGTATLVDKIFSGLALLTAIGMLGFGALILLNGYVYMSILFISFGSICGVFAIQDLRRFTGKIKHDRTHWLFGHLIRMISSYIAAVTAFAVNVVDFLPGIVLWLGPTVLGTAFIVYTIQKWRAKLGLSG